MINEEMTEESEFEDVEEYSPDEPRKYMPNEKWIERRKKYLEILEEYKNTKKCDRLEALKRMLDTHGMLIESATGWEDWLRSTHVMSMIPDKESSEILKKYIEVTERYIKFDIEATELMEKLRTKIPKPITIIQKEKKPIYMV